MKESEKLKESTVNLNIKPHNNPKASRFIALTSKMVHMIALGLPIVIIWLAQPGASLFPWHPTLMALGFSFLMTEAIMLFSPQSSILTKMSRSQKATVHWIIQLAAIFFTSAGFAVIFYNKYILNKNHFTSWHGFCGLMTMIFVLCQAFQGLSIYYPAIGLINAKLGQRKQLHALFGTLVFLLATVTIVLGYFSNWFVKNTNEYVWWGSVFSTLSLGGVILGQVSNEYAKRIQASK